MKILTLSRDRGNRIISMTEERPPETALAGRLRSRVLLALTLSAVLPILVLAYVMHGYILPFIDPSDSLRTIALFTLVVFTLLAMLAGGWVIWNLGTNVARMAEMLTDQRRTVAIGNRKDEVQTLMASFTKVLSTMEQQATEINTFANRLDTAYKELEAANARLKEVSFKDEVTGLYNRRFFSVRLQEEISRFRRFSHPLAVVLLDLDGFKAINDDLGHAAGDESLRVVADILMKHSRGINVVSRYGGDEFAVLLVETTKEGGRMYADRIRQVIETNGFAHGRPLTASFGVASLPEDDASSAEDIMKIADEALYTAKRAGRNIVATAPEKMG